MSYLVNDPSHEKWFTIATHWNVKATYAFRAPAGMKVRIRYAGVAVKQQQTLDGQSYRYINVGGWSIFVAQIQIWVPKSGGTSIAYEYAPGAVGVKFPSVYFVSVRPATS